MYFLCCEISILFILFSDTNLTSDFPIIPTFFVGLAMFIVRFIMKFRHLTTNLSDNLFEEQFNIARINPAFILKH